MKHAHAFSRDVVYVTTPEITADKCEVIRSSGQYPRKVLVESMVSGERYTVYPDWHCYETEEDARTAAEEYKNGRVDDIR